MKNLAVLLFFSFLIQSCHNARLITSNAEVKTLNELPVDKNTDNKNDNLSDASNDDVTTKKNNSTSTGDVAVTDMSVDEIFDALFISRSAPIVPDRPFDERELGYSVGHYTLSVAQIFPDEKTFSAAILKDGKRIDSIPPMARSGEVLKDHGTQIINKFLDLVSKRNTLFENLYSKLSSDYLSSVGDLEMIDPVGHMIEVTSEEVNSVEDAEVTIAPDNFTLESIKLKNLGSIDLEDTKLSDLDVTSKEKTELLTKMILGEGFYQCSDLDEDLEKEISSLELDTIVMNNDESFASSLIDLKSSNILKKYLKQEKLTLLSTYLSKSEDNTLNISIKNSNTSDVPSWSYLVDDANNTFSTEEFSELIKVIVLNGKTCIK